MIWRYPRLCEAIGDIVLFITALTAAVWMVI